MFTKEKEKEIARVAQYLQRYEMWETSFSEAVWAMIAKVSIDAEHGLNITPICGEEHKLRMLLESEFGLTFSRENTQFGAYHWISEFNHLPLVLIVDEIIDHSGTVVQD